MQELLPSEGALPLPSLQLLEDFYQKSIIDNALLHLQGLIKDRVLAVHTHRFSADDESDTGSGTITCQPLLCDL